MSLNVARSPAKCSTTATVAAVPVVGMVAVSEVGRAKVVGEIAGTEVEVARGLSGAEIVVSCTVDEKVSSSSVRGSVLGAELGPGDGAEEGSGVGADVGAGVGGRVG